MKLRRGFLAAVKVPAESHPSSRAEECQVHLLEQRVYWGCRQLDAGLLALDFHTGSSDKQRDIGDG